ncbi:MAG TPA: glycosyl hydrolase family 28-related protein [Geminicoccaceae bacterium]|nr:glycosyl hydrolase family 28-related protein [Geminicoccaceae bacterium]
MSNTFTRDPQPRIQYSGNGSRTTFGFPFPVLASDDLLVYVNDTPATGFAISGLADPAGGEIDFIEPPAAGTNITLLRRTEGIRETEFVDGGPFRAAAINAELDRIMLLIQENREEHNRALRARPIEAASDFCLPPTTERANRLLGFDSAGQPTVFGETELPSSGDASGVLVTSSGGTTARTLGEHVATLVNVRDFGAMGDGVTDDAAAFQAAIAAAQTRSSPVYVPASPIAYILGATLTLDGVSMVGEGAGSTLKLALSTGSALQLIGSGPRLSELRLLGPGVTAPPSEPADIDLSGVSLDGITVLSGTDAAVLHSVEVVGCHKGLMIEGGVAAIIGCRFAFNRTGMELGAGAQGSVLLSKTRFHACTSGILADGTAAFQQLALRGGALSACGVGLELSGATGDWRGIELSDLTFTNNLEADLRVGPRQSMGLRGCHLDEGGKRIGAAIDLQASGETVEAPNLIAEHTRAEVTQVVTVQLSGGTNLNLLQPGDLIVLASDADDVDDHWTSLKATRGGVVHKVVSQAASTATVELATATVSPLPQAGNEIRVVGRFGTAMVDSIGASVPAGEFIWLRAEDHCRVFAAQNPMAIDQIAMGGANSDLRYLPGLGGEVAEISGVELDHGAVNGALVRLFTFTIAQNTAVSFTPPGTVGMVQAFAQSLATGDPITAIFSYRADGLGYTELLAKGTTNPSGSDVQVLQLTALTGTTGTAGKFTYSAHTDGKIYIENRRSGPPHTVAVYVVGAPA